MPSSESKPRANPLVPAPSPLALTSELFPSAPPALALRGVLWLRGVLYRALEAVFPPELAIFEKSSGVAMTHMLGAVAHFGIADHLGEARLTAADLAERAGVNTDILHRTLRALATRNVFRIHSDGTFENTKQSRLLMKGKLARTREWALYFASGSNAAAWADYGRTLETGEAAFDRVHDMTVWDWFAKHEHEEELFAHVMMGLTTQDASAVAAHYPFSELTSLCDVGGGRGTLLSELLLRHPHLKGALAESKGVLAVAKTLLEARGVLGRVTLEQRNFFESVPEGYDAYLMKNILHDWDDDTCVSILTNVRKAMAPGARLLVCETLLEPNDPNPLAALSDVHMIVACWGRERNLNDFRTLFERAGLRLGRVFPYPTTSVIEALRT